MYVKGLNFFGFVLMFVASFSFCSLSSSSYSDEELVHFKILAKCTHVLVKQTLYTNRKFTRSYTSVEVSSFSLS